jgi:hypothetical protein
MNADYFLLKKSRLGASDLAATMSGQPSPSRSAKGDSGEGLAGAVVEIDCAGGLDEAYDDVGMAVAVEVADAGVGGGFGDRFEGHRFERANRGGGEK